MREYRSKYIHQREDWSNYYWDDSAFAEELSAIHFRRGRLLTAVASIGFETQLETQLSTLVQDVQKTSEIEGVNLEQAQVRSSVASRLGLSAAGLPKPDRNVQGVVDLMLDATQNFNKPLTRKRLFEWHTSLFPYPPRGVKVGGWRDDATGPMQVVSGGIGKEKVHYEAPAAERIPTEMALFLKWFEKEKIDPILKAAIGHLWFETIHPFGDGNGRLGRAVMDMALARADGSPKRFYSMSAQILKHRKGYYNALEESQKGILDVTPWIQWFLARLSDALLSAEGVLTLVETKKRFWEAHRDTEFNDRQLRVLNRLFDGFQGALRTDKYEKLAKCPNRTASRDLADLVEKGALVKNFAGGRSTSYSLPNYP